MERNLWYAVLFSIAMCVVAVVFCIVAYNAPPSKHDGYTTNEILLMCILGLSILSALFGSVLINYFVQPNVSGFLKISGWSNHYSGGVCGLGVLTGFLLCLIFTAQLLMIAFHKKAWLKKYNAICVAIVITYFVCQLSMNSALNYHFQRGDPYLGAGLFEYMIPTYLLQIGFFILLHH